MYHHVSKQCCHSWCHGANSPYTATKVFWFLCFASQPPHTINQTESISAYLSTVKTKLANRNSHSMNSYSQGSYSRNVRPKAHMINVSCVKSAWSFAQCKASAQGYLPQARIKVASVTSCGSEKRTEVAGVGLRVSQLRVRSAWCFSKLPSRGIWNHESGKSKNLERCILSASR